MTPAPTEEDALLKLASAAHALIGYTESLEPGTVITEAYMQRMRKYYVPNLEKAVEACRSPLPEGVDAGRVETDVCGRVWENVHLRVCKDDLYKGPGHRYISYKGVIYRPEQEPSPHRTPSDEQELLAAWRPIETAPKGEQLLLCIYPVYRCFVGLKADSGEFVSVVGMDGGYPTKLGPTHWRPLPKPPAIHTHEKGKP